ncbi:hypothetical protein [Virgibacillus kimchii]
MKKNILLLFILVFTFLSACVENDNEVLEVKEDEKEIVSIGKEIDYLETVFETANKLEPEKENEYSKILGAEDFKSFVPQGSLITEVSKSLSEDKGGNEIYNVTIDYRLNNHRVIVTYFEDGYITKSDLNQETGILLSNRNNEDYEKYYFERHHSK